MKTFREAGESKVGCAIWLALILVLVILGWQIIPVRIAYAQLDDWIRQELKFGADPAWIKKSVFRKGEDLDLPVEAKNIQVDRLSHRRLRVRVHYSVTVSLLFYKHEWTLEHDITQEDYGSEI